MAENFYLSEDDVNLLARGRTIPLPGNITLIPSGGAQKLLAKLLPKPCPFCGGSHVSLILKPIAEPNYMLCSDCGARGPHGLGDPKGLWDQRAERDAD